VAAEHDAVWATVACTRRGPAVGRAALEIAFGQIDTLAGLDVVRGIGRPASITSAPVRTAGHPGGIVSRHIDIAKRHGKTLVFMTVMRTRCAAHSAF